MLLGKYRVESLIGEGGMGVVLKAHHLDLDEPVAIKCLRPEMLERGDIVQRFLREAKAAVKLKGEHVARVIDVGRLDSGIPYIVMEYLDGADLAAIVKHHGAQPPALVVDLMLQACEAIAEAHSLGIIHRDIKASNFFVTRIENEAPVLKVLDFGISTAPEGISDLTRTQSVIGTPAYMAPEQMRSSRTADTRSDIWSMGVVLYELLEGARPFRAEAYSELCLKVGMDPPMPVTNPNLTEELVAVVMKCLEKPMTHRYQSISELAVDLMPFASDPVMARARVEQCARLLGRRSVKMLEGVSGSADNDITPSARPPRSTLASGQIAVSQHRRPSLGQLKPQPIDHPETPTSIESSSGQVTSQPQPPPVRRFRWIAIGGPALVVIAMVSLYLVRSSSSQAIEAAPAPEATPVSEVTPVTERTPAPEVTPTPVTPKLEVPQPDAREVETQVDTTATDAKIESKVATVVVAKQVATTVAPRKRTPKRVPPPKRVTADHQKPVKSEDKIPAQDDLDAPFPH